jgi:DNA-binding SARP family transcriptional activator/tetratricopeptide (TPR) repeat protein
MKFRMLGHLEAENAGRLVPLGPSERKVLAILLLDAGRVVPADRILAALWDGEPPATAGKQVRNAVSRLRNLMAEAGLAGLVQTNGTGYRLAVGGECIDARVFESQVAQAERAAAAGQRADAARLLRSALALWRGPALSGVEGLMIEAAAAAWNEQRWAATETCYEHELALGRHREVTAELSALVTEHPLREKPAAQLMLALYRGGRRAEALSVYRSVRGRLADELGLEPGSELQQLHQEILTGASARAAQVPPHPAQVTPGTRPGLPAEPTRLPVPRQLPAPPRHFSGRRDQQKALDELLDEITGVIATAPVISVISGTAGIGKTALALHWAHQVAGQFPDGQLFANMRGFDPTGTPADAGEVIRCFLAALGTRPDQVPAGLEAQAGLYRTLLAGRRLLIIADNARTAEQVRPLLPSSPGCLVIITSRSQLTGLIATDDASPLYLDLFSPADARELLARRLGPDRLASDPAAASQLVDACARLPLALTIVAARAATRPSLPLAILAAELRNVRGRLDALATGDQASDVRTVFSWSYCALSPSASRMFRLLGLHPGPDITVPAAASMAGVPLAQAAAAARELSRSHLITEPVPGRFAMHDLLRAYAAEMARAHEPDCEQRTAITRMLDHYLHTAHAAAICLNPARQPLILDPAAPGTAPERPRNQRTAEDWFEAERPVLLELAGYAAQAGADRHVWRLAWVLADFLQQRGPWPEWAAVTQLGLAAAERLGDLDGQARTRHYLGYARARLAEHAEAQRHFDAALRLFAELGDEANQAHVQLTAALAMELRGRPSDALDLATQALDLYRSSGHRAGEANALNSVGWYLTQAGEHQQAVPFCQQAIDLHRELGNTHGEAAAWDSLAHVHQYLGAHACAIECYRAALKLRPGQYNKADTLTRLGDTYQAAGQTEAAREAWRQALDILEDLRHPSARALQERLVQAQCHG